MSNSNYQLKHPRKYYIWSVKAYMKPRTIMITEQLSPKYFNFQVGQFLQASISEMKLIGYKLVRDHYGYDVLETFQDTGKVMKQEIIDAHNEIYKN